MPNLPQDQSLIQSGDVQHVGTLTLPPGIGQPNGLGVDGDVMYVGTYAGPGTAGVAKVTIPPGGVGQSTLIEGPVKLPNLTQFHKSGTYDDVIPGGILVRNGKIVVSGWTYYDGSGGQVKSHWAGTSLTSMQGPYEMVVTDVSQYTDGVVRYRESMVGGYMGWVAQEWQQLFGGPALTGQCAIPIIFRTSLGPCASVFDPALVGLNNPVPSKMIVGYPYEHPTLGTWEAKPPGQFYGASDQLGSVAFPSGSRSVLFTGRHGDTNCYGPATNNPALVGTMCNPSSAYACCYDPFDALQGNHGAPYRPSMWAYDALDLLDVKNGVKKPWDVKPYARFDLPGLALDQPYYLRAGFYDQTTQRYYVGDTASNKIHVFKITVNGTPVPVDCQGTWTWTRVDGSEGQCINGQRTFQERGDFTITQPPQNGGLACPISPQFRSATEDCTLVTTTHKCVVETSSGPGALVAGTKFTITIP